MTVIYLIRHAEAMGNVLEIFQGRTDCDITEKGAAQLDCLAERFRDIKIDALYSSPLIRTLKTAEAVNRYHSLPVIKNEALIEIDGGEWEGEKWLEIERKYPVVHDNWKNHMEIFATEKGESMVTVYERMKAAVTEIAASNKGKTVAVVSHGCSVRNFLSYAESGSLNGIRQVGWSDNTAVSKIIFDDDLNPSVEFKNDSSHLPDELSTLKFSRWSKYEENK